MEYGIKQAAERMGVTISTLRYYDKEGLLPFIDKKENGTRIFKEEDLSRLDIITCLKNSGLQIKDIRRYMDLCKEGDNSLKERMDIFLERKAAVQKQLDDMNKIMDTINYKLWYYETAISAGSESVHKKKILLDKIDKK